MVSNISWAEFDQNEGKIWSVIDETNIFRGGGIHLCLSLMVIWGMEYISFIINCVLRLVCWGYGGWVRPRCGVLDASTGDGGLRRAEILNKWPSASKHLPVFSIVIIISTLIIFWKGHQPLKLSFVNVLTLSWSCSGGRAPPRSRTPSQCSSRAPWWRPPRTRARAPRGPWAPTSRPCSPPPVTPSRRTTRKPGTDIQLTKNVT